MDVFRSISASWKVLLAIVSAILAALFYGINWPKEGLNERFKEPAVVYLQTEQVRRAMAEYAPNGVDKLNREELQKLAVATEAGRKVTISSLQVRGKLRYAVAEVRYQVNGKTPPDGRDVRYLLFRQSGFGDWHVDSNSTVLRYYLAF